MPRCMRTTLTLDDDVAARLDQLRKERELPLREIVNEALRAGLDALAEPVACPPYRTRPVALRPRVRDLDDVERLLDDVDGAWRR